MLVFVLFCIFSGCCLPSSFDSYLLLFRFDAISTGSSSGWTNVGSGSFHGFDIDSAYVRTIHTVPIQKKYDRKS